MSKRKKKKRLRLPRLENNPEPEPRPDHWLKKDLTRTIVLTTLIVGTELFLYLLLTRK